MNDVNITRYSNNRKLYITGKTGNEKGQYANASSLMEFLKEGRKVTITCQKTKLDITQRVLLTMVPQFAKLSLDETINLLLNKGNK